MTWGTMASCRTCLFVNTYVQVLVFLEAVLQAV